MIFARKACKNPNCCDGTEEIVNNKESPCKFEAKCVAACAAYGRVCPFAAKSAAKSACKAIKELSQDSKIFTSKPDFEHWNADDLVIGKTLGCGGFSEVHEVSLKQVTCSKNDKPLAVKYLKQQAMVQRRTFEHGAADLAMEGYFLATLDHKHIIKLHGVTAGAVENNIASGKECGFFILVDRLYDTLESRIDTWKESFKLINGNGGILYKRSAVFKTKRMNHLMSRLKVAADLSDALCYLHSLDVVYRDFKPDNVGFDSTGVVKMFDFGLAKELRSSDADEYGYYKMTGNTGSRRYMAPEVARGMRYGLPVDVYSFGILLWELCALEKPFDGFTAQRHQNEVVLGGLRPSMDNNITSWWPVSLQWLIKKCWSRAPKDRPTMEKVRSTLQEILKEASTVATTSKSDESVEASPGRANFKSMAKPTKAKGKSWGITKWRPNQGPHLSGAAA
mmetsp:Transcript_10866/g.16608  ORF Transcript_10866/g.16608 Transcript_10866/m.16608 type:complete len:450 (-) Transcript_10866:299-1648(-)